MPDFPKPKFAYTYSVADEIYRLRAHKRTRAVPVRRSGRLLVATWNIANLGTQDRRDQDRALLAEVLSWFDLVAVQETKSGFGDLLDLQQRLGPRHRVLMSDPGGNDERMAFVYDARKLTLLEEIGEIGVPPRDVRHIKLPGVRGKFAGFDRNPFLGTWQAGRMSLLLANCHLYFGKQDDRASVDRRCLEAFAVARWAQLRQRSTTSYTRHTLALGDVNMPKAEPGDPVYDALTRLGLTLPGHSTRIASSVVSDAQYDQIAFIPAETQSRFTGRKGVFDFDQVVFKDLYDRSARDFKAYLKYYLSDHRPMWLELNTE
jgi:endonuclease/exonuclease/phosphatase family metal-dependent hydrolase